ncbi:sortase domain-bontaining protein [Schleiferilactobacillus harbinensis]|uniref:sortase domain-containing protein n=1 Tax=Schleiferilactobacillus harbinensis TaxID=304207 RepID=UPI0007B78F4E|nr:sortase [Schleiferilactobacillus harbinensis]
MEKKSFRRSLITIMAGITLLAPVALTIGDTAPTQTVQAAAAATARITSSQTLYNGFGSQKNSTGRTLRRGSSWQVFKRGIGNDGSVWLNVGGDQWISAGAVSLANGSALPTVYDRINYDRPVVKLYGSANQRQAAHNNVVVDKRLNSMSSWNVSDVARADGHWWFQIGSYYQWVSDANGVFVSPALEKMLNGTDGTQVATSPTNTSTLNIHTVAATTLRQGYGDNAPVLRTLPANSVWKVFQEVDYAGGAYYDLGGGQFVNNADIGSHFYLEGDSSKLQRVTKSNSDNSGSTNDGQTATPSVPKVEPKPSVDPNAGKTPGSQANPITNGSIKHGIEKANTIIINGYQVNYLDDQSTVPNDIAWSNYYQMTPKEWFGMQYAGVWRLNGPTSATSVLSVSDNKNSYLFGHNFGVFTPLLSTQPGDVLTITDAADNTRNYRIDYIYKIKNSTSDWTDLYTGQPMYFLLQAGNKEQVSLQTCTDYSGAYSYVYVADGI